MLGTAGGINYEFGGPEFSIRMSQFLKQTVRTIVPSSVLNLAMAARERGRLAKIPRGNFDGGRLKALSRAQIDAAFTDETIAAAWQHDLDSIARVMPYADIYGGVCPGERRAIYQLITWLKPRRVLEIGTHIGASTLVIAQALASHGGSDSLLVTGDILDVNHPEQGAYKQLGTLSPRDGLHQLGLEDRVRFVAKPALDLMRELDQKFDFIFLDGDHSAPAVYQEISAALNILAPDGLILLHDFYPAGKRIYPSGTIVPGPFVAARRVHSEFPSLRFMPLGELPWETKQGVKRTSLALVSRD
jgi:predicted O-methyltransferase YrrM